MGKSFRTSFWAVLMLLPVSVSLHAQCNPGASAVYSFTTNGVPYEVIKAGKSWPAAAACAASRGGRLAEINSRKEQDSVFYYVSHAGINASNTVAPDGGGASYVWLGGNDIATEGNWIWDGTNSGSGSQFWQGDVSGHAIGNSFTNWGNEPDNFGGNQDGLGLAITNWPMGIAGQWNDLDTANSLFFIIEYPPFSSAVNEIYTQPDKPLVHNPASGMLHLLLAPDVHPDVVITDMTGRVVLRQSGDTQVDISAIRPGLYLLMIRQDNRVFRQKLQVQ